MISRYLATAAALVGLAAAQTSSECNPLNQTNCDPNPAFGTEAYWHFNQTPSLDLWRTTVGSVPYDADKGATFTINKQGDSPTIRTNFYFFFGRTELHLKAASGVGIVSSMMWLSDDLDEVDWELLGYNNTHATTNYFGKGREDFSVAQQHYMKDGMQDDYHNYTTTWTSSQLQWYIDGELVRTLKPAEANSTDNYPQTPMRLSIGIWAGGDPDLPDGTREWAGGTTNYDDGPFTMYVKSATVEDYSSGKEYAYSDQSGHWKSIKITAGNSTAYEALHTEPEKTTGEKWESLPVATKTAVYAGGAGAGAAAIAALAFFMMRARRAGGAEAAQAEKAESERVELMRFKNGEDTANQGHEYSSGGVDEAVREEQSWMDVVDGSLGELTSSADKNNPGIGCFRLG